MLCISPVLSPVTTHFYSTTSSGQFELTGTLRPRRYESLSAPPEPISKSEGGQYGRFATRILEAVNEDINFAQFNSDGPDGVSCAAETSLFIVRDLKTARNACSPWKG